MKRALLALLLLVSLAAAATAAAQTPPPSTADKDALVYQQMHAYLDTLIEVQAKLVAAQRREADWAAYSRPLWAPDEKKTSER